jgi:bifunctional UDP-N-acetylglucosamine pyrophosphorylase/glucosamine-1-phosphate N-acetyltransferase
MKSRTPKVLHTIADRTLLEHVVAAVRALDPDHVIVVVGHGRDAVSARLAAAAPEARSVVQEQQNGTGHAVRIALDALATEAGEVSGTIVVVPGDAPLLRAETLRQLLARHAQQSAVATLLTAELPDPTGYGRVLRDAAGLVRAIVEQKDATPEQLALHEVGVSVYAFEAAPLTSALRRLTTDNAQGEEYLTDVVGLLVADAATVAAVCAPDWRETLGVNDRVQLAEAGRLLNEQIVERWMRAGVTVVDPRTTWIGVDVTLEPDVVLHPNTQLAGRTSIARGARVGPDCTLTDTLVEQDAVVRRATCEGASIGPEASVGPYTYLRPGTRLGRNSRAGGFVEMKNATVGDASKVPHLSYVGDATIGQRSNVGAATVFVNYDGERKHRTTVGDDVRIGSDTMLVAPVEIGHHAYTAAGSVITVDVPPGALAVGRARQRNIEGWVARRRGGGAAAGDREQGARQ